MCHKMRKTGKQYAGPSFISQVFATHKYCWDQGEHCNCNTVPDISEYERVEKNFLFFFWIIWHSILVSILCIKWEKKESSSTFSDVSWVTHS